MQSISVEEDWLGRVVARRNASEHGLAVPVEKVARDLEDLSSHIERYRIHRTVLIGL